MCPPPDRFKGAPTAELEPAEAAGAGACCSTCWITCSTALLRLCDRPPCCAERRLWPGRGRSPCALPCNALPCNVSLSPRARAYSCDVVCRWPCWRYYCCCSCCCTAIAVPPASCRRASGIAWRSAVLEPALAPAPVSAPTPTPALACENEPR